MAQVTFRFGERKDVPLIMEFVRLLAEHEGVPEAVAVTEELIEEWVFEKERARVLFLEEDGKAAGFALYFPTFATYPGRGGIYLDDLYVKKEYRGRGYGKALLKKLAQIVLEHGEARIEWLCLNDNPSYEFYTAMGANPLRTCTTFRMEGEALRAFAGDSCKSRILG